MRKPSAMAGVVLVLSACLFMIGQAADWEARSHEDTVYTRLSPNEMNAILDHMGIEYEYETAFGGPMWMYDFLGVGIMLKGDVDDIGIVDLMGYSYTEFRGEPDYGAINRWNETSRFSRAYVDEDGDAVVEFDLDIEGGVTLKAIENFVEMFNAVAWIFSMQVGGVR